MRWEKEGKEPCRAVREGDRGATIVVDSGVVGSWMGAVVAVFGAAESEAGFSLFNAEALVVVIGPCIVLISHVLSWLE
jgi:hypothetical protein